MNGQLRGLQIGTMTPEVSFLLFADDSLLFMEATKHSTSTLSEFWKIMRMLLDKSLNFKSHQLSEKRQVKDHMQEIKNILGMIEYVGDGKYLGLPCMVGKKRPQYI